MVTMAAASASAGERFITVASTTSTANSGLFDHLLPMFQKATGIQVRVVAVGTGQALKLARNGDADVLLVHHRTSEEAFVAEGFGVARHDVMYNDFVVLGPADDPAGVAGMNDVAKAFKKLADSQAMFASRGDDSGTHKKERELWEAANLDPTGNSGQWYRETGSGMGATLNTAVALGAYVLSDRATWLTFKNKRDHKVVVEGDVRMFNPYGVILVNPEKHPHVKKADGQAFVDWLISPTGQAAIASYRSNGTQLFFPNANGSS
jgi:tungstate transport system substrate-binding protein